MGPAEETIGPEKTTGFETSVIEVNWLAYMVTVPTPTALPAGLGLIGLIATRRRRALKVFGTIFALLIVFALTLFWIYGTDTHHANRSSIWWSERGRNLIPPAATDITLRQDFLDHYAIYTISEKELNAFLDRRFARPGEALDSFSERSPANPESIGKAIGPLGWVATEDTVEYSYSASNGGGHHFYHDTNTGLTYQDSAYW